MYNLSRWCPPLFPPHLYSESPITSLSPHQDFLFYDLFISDTPSPVPASHIIRSVRTFTAEWVICEWSWSQRKVTAHHPSTIYWQYLLNRGRVLVVSPQSMWYFNWTDLAKDLVQVVTVVSSCVGQLSHVHRLSLPSGSCILSELLNALYNFEIGKCMNTSKSFSLCPLLHNK